MPSKGISVSASMSTVFIVFLMIVMFYSFRFASAKLLNLFGNDITKCYNVFSMCCSTQQEAKKRHGTRRTMPDNGRTTPRRKADNIKQKYQPLRGQPMTTLWSSDDQAAVNGRPRRGQTMTRPWSSLQPASLAPPYEACRHQQMCNTAFSTHSQMRSEALYMNL